MTTEPSAPALPAAAPKVPYRGIEEFRYVDAPIFFGRDFEARRLLRLVTIYRGVLLYGDSGVGKSSLVNAKAMPLAVKDGYAPERVRVQPVEGAEFVVERIAPSDEPGVFLPSLFDDGKQTRRIGVAAGDFLARLIQMCRVGDSHAATYPLIVFDQFEELVTLTEEALYRKEESAQEAHDAIVRTLLQILRDDTLRVKLLFVFREDYYAKLTRFFAQCPTLVDSYLRVEPMRNSQLDDIISGPFRAAAFDHELPADVAEALKSELTERSDLLTLSEVQIACLHLWRAPDPHKLLQSQHVSGILETYFSEAIEALPFALRDPAIALLDELVTESGTRNVISTETLVEALATEYGTANDVTRQALDALDKTAHVIRRERRNEVEVYEIVSEFLVPWIMRRKVEAVAQRNYETRLAHTRKVARRLLVGFAVAVALFIAGAIIWEMTASQQYLRRQVAVLKSKLEEAENTRRGDEQRHSAAVATLQNSVVRANQAKDAAERALAAEAAQTAAERNGRVAAETDRDAARASADVARVRLANVEGRIRALEESVADGKTERDKIAKELQDVKADRDKLAKERDSLKSGLDKTTTTTLAPRMAWSRTNLGLVVSELTAELRTKYRALSMPGVVVTEVVKDSPAAAANLHEGDVIFRASAQDRKSESIPRTNPVTNIDEFWSAISHAKSEKYMYFTARSPSPPGEERYFDPYWLKLRTLTRKP